MGPTLDDERRPTCVELFCGAGGAFVGISRAGFEHLAAVEIELDPANTLHLATHSTGIFTQVITGDVTWTSTHDTVEAYVRRTLGRPDGDVVVDLLWASPPCQDFSTSGKKAGARGKRNGWPWTTDFIDDMRRRGIEFTSVVCENVEGVHLHKRACSAHPRRRDRRPGNPTACNGCYWEQVVVPSFEARFPHVTWKLLDAADYGVPQRRRRIILVAGANPYSWPAPSHSVEALAHAKWTTGEYWIRVGVEPCGAPTRDERRALALASPTPPTERPWVTIRQALDLHDPVEGSNKGRRLGGIVRGPVVTEPDRPSLTIDQVPGHVRVGEGKRRPHNLGVRTASSVPEHALDSKWWNRSVEADEPSRSISTARNNTIEEANGRRQLEPEECAALQGFPAGWPFSGGRTSAYKQIGNAVPPELARAVVTPIADMFRARAIARRVDALVTS